MHWYISDEKYGSIAEMITGRIRNRSLKFGG